MGYKAFGIHDTQGERKNLPVWIDGCMSYFYKEKVMIHKKPRCALPAQVPITQKKPQKMKEKPNVQGRRGTMLGQIHIPASCCIASCMQFSRRSYRKS